MTQENRLDGKRILIVDDEPDILDSLKELLNMCILVEASSFEEAKKLLEEEFFHLAVLDIMGVKGYELLDICREKEIPTAMLTAYSVTPEDIEKSFQNGAASFVPKDELLNIEVFLQDILEAKEKGKSLWWRWFDRLADYCEKKFGPDWQKEHHISVR